MYLVKNTMRAAASCGRAISSRSRTVVCRAQNSSAFSRRQALAGAVLTAGAMMAPLSANAVPSSHSPFYQKDKIVLVPVTDKLLKDQGTLDWPIWEKEVGRYNYTYDIDEDFYFLKGKVIVTPVGGEPVTIKAGDYAMVPAGTVCEWNIIEPVRKHYKEYE